MSAKNPNLQASRILNATRVAQAADDTPVTDWSLSAPFIVVMQLDETAGPWTATYKIRWRRTLGTFADLGATGEMKTTTATDLTNGNAVTIGEKACTNTPSGPWQDGEEVEGTGTADSITLQDEDYTEVHFAVDPADANDFQEYEFEIYDVTNGAAIGTAEATLTTGAGAASYDLVPSDSYILLAADNVTMEYETDDDLVPSDSYILLAADNVTVEYVVVYDLVPSDSYILLAADNVTVEYVVVYDLIPSDSYILLAADNVTMEYETTDDLIPSDSYILLAADNVTVEYETTDDLIPSDSYIIM